MTNFSFTRLWAMIIKEFWQIKRDRPTLIMMIGIPLMQLIMFGFAINANPHNLPTALVSADNGPYVRTFLQAVENTEYFKFLPGNKTEQEAQYLLASNKTQFVINIPANFSRDLARGTQPSILVEADATDPSATSFALSALNNLVPVVFKNNLTGSLSFVQTNRPAFNLIIHSLYNPESITQYNIIPGLLGVTLTLTMVFITALAMTRERERGTMENLLATPVRPLEIIVGKITPYIVIGYIQAILILLAAYFIFHVPNAGSVPLLLITCLPFIAANLAMGLTFSTISKNQLQAVQGSMFFFLPSMLLTGFMFPFHGMPYWAQIIGNILPLTHFLLITRGILLKGNGPGIVWLEVWPILLFTTVVIGIGLKWFRQTID